MDISIISAVIFNFCFHWKRDVRSRERASGLQHEEVFAIGWCRFPKKCDLSGAGSDASLKPLVVLRVRIFEELKGE